MRSPLAILLGLVVLAPAACGSKSSGVAPTGDGGLGDGGLGDGGGNWKPAYKPDIGQIQKGGGPVIASPRIVTVTWNADPNQAALEDFGDKLGASSYWQAAVGEYGVGAATSGAANHVRISTAPPATIDPDTVSTMLKTGITTAGSGWPPTDGSTIYAIYIPPGTTITPSDVFHSEAQITGNAHVPYVVINESLTDKGSAFDTTTANASHEIAEAATNPHVLSDTAFVGFDAQHIAWNMFVSDAEIGDICELYQGVELKPADLPYSVQRLWSNKAAAAGANPCVPKLDEPYYNVTPLDLETVSVFVDTAATASSGLGYRINIGSKKTIRFGFYSDRAVSGPWTLTAVEGNFFSPASNHRIDISVDKGTGNNGDVGEITVTATTKNQGAGNAVLMTVTSQAPGLQPHTVPVLIGTY